MSISSSPSDTFSQQSTLCCTCKGGYIFYLHGKGISLEAFINTLELNPDEAFIQNDGQVAYVFDTEREEVLCLKGDFTGFREKIAWELRNAISEQHPRVYDEK